MRFPLCLVALVALSACSPSIPDSGAPNTGTGVGFGSYDEYLAQQRAREAALAGNALPPAGAVSDEAPADGSITTVRTGGMPAASPSEQLAADATAALNQTSTGSDDGVVHASPSNPAPVTVTTATGISDENDFNAVGNARSIESDAALIERNRAQYQIVQPTALPSRSGATGPNIVKYALATKHPVGTQIYTRVGINKQAKFQRNCAKYPSPDKAQIDFLAQGGPKRDKLGLDPDGDGYACNWDPRPFRAAVGG